MFKNLVFISILVLVLSACDNGGGGGPAPKVRVKGTNEERIKISCAYGFAEGGSAPASPLAPQIKTSLFAKRYDANLIDAVVGASASELVRFAQTTGVIFYQVENQDAAQFGCLFGNMPKPTSIVAEQFRQEEKDVKDRNPDAMLEGFYLDKDSMIVITSNKSNQPTIVVLDDTDKYVMIHEFMHHVFAVQRNPTYSQLNNAYKISGNAYNQAARTYDADRNMTNLETMSAKFETLVNNYVAFLAAGALEEIANESELNVRYQGGQLKYVHELSRESGDWYISVTADRGLSLLKGSHLEDIAQQISSELTKLGASTIVESSLQRATNAINSLKNEITDAQAQANARMHKPGKTNISGLIASGAVATPHCAYADEASKLLEQVSSQLVQIH